MQNTNSYFDMISIVAGLICIQTLRQLWQNWSGFWSDRISAEDRELAQRLAMFVLVPIGVLLHEIGHSLATWQLGGRVLIFQWRFYWGYIVPSGHFDATEYWWIALSGNLVSILLGLLPIPFILHIRKRIIGEVLYSFVCFESVYSLIGYPLLSFAMAGGDWVQIYNFEVQPYASLTLIAHILLLSGLWQLYHSQKAMRWRLARQSNVLETWKQLQTNATNQPDELEPNLELAYFLLQHNELREAKKYARKSDRIAPDDNRVKLFRVAIDSMRQSYRQAVRSGRRLLDADLSSRDRLYLYRILCFCSYKISRLSEALSYADRGLAIAPDDYRLRYYRAIVYAMLGQRENAIADLDIALASDPDETSRKQMQKWFDRSIGRF